MSGTTPWPRESSWPIVVIRQPWLDRQKYHTELDNVRPASVDPNGVVLVVVVAAAAGVVQNGATRMGERMHPLPYWMYQYQSRRAGVLQEREWEKPCILLLV